MQPPPTDLRELEMRHRIEQEVRGEVASEKEADLAHDRAMKALVISAVSLACVVLPILGLILGLSWRIMRWAAGYGW